MALMSSCMRVLRLLGDLTITNEPLKIATELAARYTGWTGVELSKGGAARPQCAGDTVYLKSAPVLSYGQSWSRAGITCFSRRTGLECGSEAGHGFNLARQFWGVF